MAQLTTFFDGFTTVKGHNCKHHQNAFLNIFNALEARKHVIEADWIDRHGQKPRQASHPKRHVPGRNQAIQLWGNLISGEMFESQSGQAC